MESETQRSMARYKQEEENWRRRCGCLRTSEKLRRILDSFPPPPPPTPEYPKTANNLGSTCISAFCTNLHHPIPNKVVKLFKEPLEEPEDIRKVEEKPTVKMNNKSWHVVTEFLQLIQMSVMATALALYYLIYCYMQLVYYMLRSALYFHNADGAMKITIAVVTITSFVVAFNLILKLERFIGIFS